MLHHLQIVFVKFVTCVLTWMLDAWLACGHSRPPVQTIELRSAQRNSEKKHALLLDVLIRIIYIPQMNG